jgi:hypothetical protein
MPVIPTLPGHATAARPINWRRWMSLYTHLIRNDPNTLGNNKSEQRSHTRCNEVVRSLRRYYVRDGPVSGPPHNTCLFIAG